MQENDPHRLEILSRMRISRVLQLLRQQDRRVRQVLFQLWDRTLNEVDPFSTQRRTIVRTITRPNKPAPNSLGRHCETLACCPAISSCSSAPSSTFGARAMIVVPYRILMTMREDRAEARRRVIDAQVAAEQTRSLKSKWRRLQLMQEAILQG